MFSNVAYIFFFSETPILIVESVYVQCLSLSFKSFLNSVFFPFWFLSSLLFNFQFNISFYLIILWGHYIVFLFAFLPLLVVSSLLKCFLKKIISVSFVSLSLHLWGVFFFFSDSDVVLSYLVSLLISIDSFWSILVWYMGMYFWHAFIIGSVFLLILFLIIKYRIWPQSLPL